MSQPFERLDRISEVSKKGGIIDGLYRLMYNKELWIKAYCKLAKNPGNLAIGTDGESINGTGLTTIEGLIKDLKDKRFRFSPVRRVYIPKSRGNEHRPIGIPCFRDKLVQEVMRIILEAVYEPIFISHSHGFRPGRSCHTAIDSIRYGWAGTSWFLEGDISSCFDSVCHKTLLKIIAKRISCKNFLRLIHNFMKCGWMENWNYRETFSGVPQGGVLSPIAMNIYMHELDCFIVKMATSYKKGKRRKENPVVKRLASKLTRRRGKVKKGDYLHQNRIWQGREQLIKEIQYLKKKKREHPATESRDTNFRRLNYVRYCDDFLIGIIGPKKECLKIKKKIAYFIKDKLKLTLSDHKTKITNGHSKARFLNFDISISDAIKGRISPMKPGSPHKLRTTTRRPVIKAPVDRIAKFFASRDCGDYMNDKPAHRKGLVCNSDGEIFMQLSTELRGLFNYYGIATSVGGALSRAEWFMLRVLTKTLAAKHKSTGTREGRKLKNHTRRYVMQIGDKKHAFVSVRDYKGKLGKLSSIKSRKDLDLVTTLGRFRGSSELEKRLLANECEACGDNNGPFQVHHIRRVKDLHKQKNKTKVEFIHITRQRRTVILCKDCHLEHHHGKF